MWGEDAQERAGGERRNGQGQDGSQPGRQSGLARKQLQLGAAPKPPGADAALRKLQAELGLGRFWRGLGSDGQRRGQRQKCPGRTGGLRLEGRALRATRDGVSASAADR